MRFESREVLGPLKRSDPPGGSETLCRVPERAGTPIERHAQTYTSVQTIVAILPKCPNPQIRSPIAIAAQIPREVPDPFRLEFRVVVFPPSRHLLFRLALRPASLLLVGLVQRFVICVPVSCSAS
jgi:hypothetical protein